MKGEYFKEKIEKARRLYNSQKKIYCPYFKQDVILNSDGFHHLRYSARSERSKEAQLLKFNLLPLALPIIKSSGTIQEYRKCLIASGKTSVRDGLTLMKIAEYWGLAAIVGRDNDAKVRVIIRRVGDGNIVFWSVMPDIKFKPAGGQKLYTTGIEDD